MPVFETHVRYPYWDEGIERDLVMFTLVFQIGPQTDIPMERVRRELSIEMAVGVVGLS